MKYAHILNKIAARHLGLKTLEARNSDSLDFHELSVHQIRKALENAYIAGMMHEVAQPFRLRCPACRSETDIWCDRRTAMCGTCYHCAPASDFDVKP